MLTALNNLVAVKPLGALSVNVKKNAGFATVEQKTTLASSEVVFPPAVDSNKPFVNIQPGDVVFFRADDLHEYARQVYSLKLKPDDLLETQFILLPLDRVKLWKSNRFLPPLPFGLGPAT